MASGLFVAGGGRTGHLLGRARVAQAENDEEHGPTGAVGRTIKGAQEAILEILAKWMAGPQGVRRAYYERVGYCRLRVLKREMNADNSVSAHSGQWESYDGRGHSIHN